MRRCGLFYISTLVTITITRKEFVINFLMFKHNIFLLLVFDSVSQRPVLYCFLVFFKYCCFCFNATSAIVLPKVGFFYYSS